MVSHPALVAHGARGLGCIFEERPLERGGAPGSRDDARAIVGTDFGLIGLDNEIEVGGIDVALLRQNRVRRAPPRLRLGKLGAVGVLIMGVLIVGVLMIVDVCGHGIVKTFTVSCSLLCNAPALPGEPSGE